MTSTAYKVGDRVILDGDTPATVTTVGVYVNASMHNRETGVSVRPDAGGRARPVALYRIEMATDA